MAVFTLSNPYLPLNLLLHRDVLHSNVGNYGTFYQPHFSMSAVGVAGRLLMTGLSPAPAVLGALAVIIFIRSRPTRGWLLAAPAGVVLMQFILLADGKMAEYARFAILLDIIIAILAAALIGRLKIKVRERGLMGAWLILITLYFGVRYDINFIADGWDNCTRRLATQAIESQQADAHTLAVWNDPAPYCLPPVDLFHWQLVLLPHMATAAAAGQISVRPVDNLIAAPSGLEEVRARLKPARAASPISWANKPFEILRVK